jgi:hypothetical protein
MKHLPAGTGGHAHPDETPPCIHPWKKKAGGGLRGEGRPRADCARGAGIGLREFEEVKRNQRDVAVAAAGRVSPSAIHAFASVWDCRFTKR